MTSIETLFGARTAEIVADAVGGELAAEVRARLERAGYQRYQLLDRGSYDLVEHPTEPALIEAITALASRMTRRALAVVRARALRLVPGDYLLAHHDPIHDDLPIELVLDLSPASVPGAEVHYRRRGQVVFRVPCQPGALAIIERGPTMSCNHTYVSKLQPGASVVRLVVLLRGA